MEKKASIRIQRPRSNFLDITALIRSLQRAEGNPDCFRKSKGFCERLDCEWRKYCLNPNETGDEEDASSE